MAAKALLPSLQAVKEVSQLTAVMYEIRTVLRARKGGQIKVQPTSVARRHLGITRGCKRIAAGRPCTSSGGKPLRKTPSCAR